MGASPRLKALNVLPIPPKWDSLWVGPVNDRWAFIFCPTYAGWILVHRGSILLGLASWLECEALAPTRTSPPTDKSLKPAIDAALVDQISRNIRADDCGRAEPFARVRPVTAAMLAVAAPQRIVTSKEREQVQVHRFLH